jgi:Predicted HD superfamily hydrolase
MNPLDIISNYYNPASGVYHLLVVHSRNVADKALALAALHPELNIDTRFVEEAAMLHDIGIFLCDAPGIACYGEYPYICHGYLGADLLRKEGLERHALVCERHTGTGISLAMIEKEGLPLPHRDMLPVSIEEQLICFADKFYSKTKLDTEKPIKKIKKSLSKYGSETEARFEEWRKLFLGE